MKTYNEIIAIIAEILEVNPEVLNEKSSVGLVENWDSIHQLMIISSIEEKYGISFPEDSLFEMTSIEAMVRATETEIKR